MDQDMSNVTRLSLRDIAPLVPTLAVGATVICFSLGLVVVNLRLARYGVFSSEFARTEYILVGALFMLLVALTAATVSYGLKSWKAGIEKWKNGQRKFGALTIFGAVISVTLVLTGALLILSDYQLSPDDWRMWLAVLVLIFIARAARHSRDLLTDLWNVFAGERRSNPRPEEPESRYYRVLTAIPWVLLHIAVYSGLVYPYLSPAYGGGRKGQVLLVPTSAGLEVCKTLGLPFRSDGKVVGPLDLLTEASTEVVVLLPAVISDAHSPRSFRLSRDILQAVVSVKPEPPK